MKIAHAFLVAVFSVTSYANAVVITADFEAIPLGINATNYNEAGFTFSPNCHFDGVDPDFSIATSRWIGFDSAGCAGDDIFNPAFLGPPEHQVIAGSTTDVDTAVLYVDRGGSPFSLLSLDVVIGDWTLTSSNGGLFDSSDPETVLFAGPTWTNVNWLLFEISGAGAPVGFDNLTAEAFVPAPATLPLMLVPLVGLLLRRQPRS